MALRSLLFVLILAACRQAEAPAAPYRRGCRMDLATHVAKCPCARAADLVEMPDRPDLETLRIHFADDADPRALERLTHVRTLEVAHPTTAQLAAVATLSRVTSLKLIAYDPRYLERLATMRQLRSLTLRGAHAVEIDLSPLAGLRALRVIRIEGRAAVLLGRSAFGPDVEIRNEEGEPRPSPSGGGGICEIDPSACPKWGDLEDWTCTDFPAEVYAY